ncbi:MAG: type II secretion system F family protein [Patescibacteria group bacterium]
MQFTYIARTLEGAERKGTIEAPSSETAVQALQRQNLIVVKLVSSDPGATWSGALLSRFRHIKQRDVVILARQLATLFEAKVPVVRTFQTLIGEAEATPMKYHLAAILDDIQGGSSMSQAMAKHEEVFSAFFVQMVHAGEEAGRLDEVFTYLADYLERTYTIMTKARNALIYPMFILLAFVGIMVYMLTSIVPKISKIIEEAGQALPLYTRIVIGMSDILRNYWILIILLLMAISGFLVWYKRTPDGSRAWNRAQLQVPVVGNLYQKLYLSRLADNLQTLVAGGIPIVRALEITAEVVGNEIYRSIVLEAVEAVRGGSSISDAFAKHPEIPSLLTQMIRVGEETGKLDQLLRAVSRFYEHEVNNLVDNLVSLIEPILILVLGIGVGFIVVAVMSPIYNLANAF